MSQRHFKPVVVEVDGDLFEIHLGKPGLPRVYRRKGASRRRVANDDPVLDAVAVEFRRGVDDRKAAEEAERLRRSTWRYRVGKRIGRWWAAIVGTLNRGLAALAWRR